MADTQAGEDTQTGGCLCGAVRYQTAGQPAVSLACHCTLCRRLTGTAFSTLLFFPGPNVTFEGRRPKVYDHRSADHGRMFHLQFCPDCGVHVGLQIERGPAFQLICAGTLDRPDAFRIRLHMFTRSAVNWTAFPADVPCYLEHFLTEQGERAEPLPRKTVPWSMADIT